MSENHEKVFRTLNYFEIVSAVCSCVSIFAFASLVGPSVGIQISAVGLKTCALTAKIKNISQSLRKPEKHMIV